MEQDRQSRWQPTRRQVLWTVGIVATAVVLAYIGYFIPRTGFGQTAVKGGVQPAKTLWDWMDLLIIPIVLAIGGFLFTRSENRATQAAAERQNQATQAAAERRAQEDALQAYLDNMAEMLISNNDQPSLSDEHPLDSLKTVARARTLTVLPRLGGDGKARVVQFLYESGLIHKDRGIVDLKRADLSGANLRGANLRGVNLSETNLSGANLSGANLSGANLSDTEFWEADLSWADLSGALLVEAILLGTNLRNTKLSGANLTLAYLSGSYVGKLGRTTLGARLSHADLTRANLDGAHLWHADLSHAILIEAHLRGAKLKIGADLREAHGDLFVNLRHAVLTGADLSHAMGWTELTKRNAQSLIGATMPDGQKYEDWLETTEGQKRFNTHKDPAEYREKRDRDIFGELLDSLKAKEDRGEDGENRGP